ncbi:MAG: hypothetical protein IVW52_04980 [Acidimicrobiales bacterium]|nr:hypothetical protein [Acidimicrobiales bacterium]
MTEEDEDRYRRAAHAMQSGVALDHARNGAHDATPKHLRVGVNSALVDSGALAELLIQKGVVTRDEYVKALADGMEREVDLYRERLGLGPNVELG